MTEKVAKGKRERVNFKQKLVQKKQKRDEIKRKRNSWQYDEQDLKNDIVREARAVGMPAGTAEAVAEKVVHEVTKWVTKRVTVTVDDIHRRVALEMSKYNADLAYVYQNRGKII